MPMNPNFLCCIGAELKNSTQQTTRMTQVYLYRAFESETIADMLSAGFFNQALGIIRQDDLLLLYSPNETNPRWVYARVSSATRDGIEISKVDIQAQDISVDTTGYSNLSGNNLQEILNNLDTTITTINNAFVKKDGSSIMTGPLKMRAGSMQGAIAAYWDGVGFFKLNSNDSVTLLASMEATDGLCPAADNTYNIGKTNYKWKDAYIARVITAVLNNGYDIAVPVTNSPQTLALKSEVDLAANSGSQLYATGVWYAKMYSASTVPTGAEYDGRNYADFSQVDNDNNPIIVIYTGVSGVWTETDRITPPASYNGYVTITSKIWDIAEQTDQQGGEVLWSYNQKTFTPYPKIISLLNQANTNLNNLTSTGQNISNWSSNVTNCVTNIPQDIQLELNNGTLTLKAGSKVYVPNGISDGTPVYDEVTITSDIAINPGSGTDGTKLLFYYTTGSGMSVTNVNSCYSGTTTPSDGMYFNRNANTIKYYYNGNPENDVFSLPLAEISIISGTVYLNKIFNGLGYIGSTVFALPGVKGLIPNGRNADGTLNNTVTNNYNTVKTVQVNTSTAKIGIYVNGSLGSQTNGFELNEQENFNYDTGVLTNALEVANVVVDSNARITAFTPKTVFHAVDYSEADFVVAFQRPTAENNYTWYRKYKSGWVEQGGVITGLTNASPSWILVTVNLPVKMSGSVYTITLSDVGIGSAIQAGCRVDTLTTTDFAFRYYNAASTSVVGWEVKGMAA